MCIVGAGLCVQFQAHGQPSVVYRAFDESFGTQFHQIVVGKNTAFDASFYIGNLYNLENC